MEAFIGTIEIFSGNFAPKGWLLCNGASLETKDYGALFNLIGYKYGGTGTKFNIPDLQGKLPIGCGIRGGNSYDLGSSYGKEKIFLTGKNMPLINGNGNVDLEASAAGVVSGMANADISIPCDSTGSGILTNISANKFIANGNSADSGGSPAKNFSDTQNNFLKTFSAPVPFSFNVNLPVTLTKPATFNFATAGESAPIDIMPPVLGVNYIICYQGYYPEANNRRLLEDDKIPEVIHLKPEVYYGALHFGASTGKKMEVVVQHNWELGEKAMQYIQCSVINSESFSDAFTVSIKGGTLGSNSFIAVVTRIDGDSWAQTRALLQYTVAAYRGMPSPKA